MHEFSRSRIESVYIIWGYEFIFLDELDIDDIIGLLCVKYYLCDQSRLYEKSFNC